MARTKWTPSGRRAIKIRMKQFKEDAAQVYHYESDTDAQIIEFVMMPAVALLWGKENPLWGQVIGAPGSGKTAHIMLYEDWKNSVMVSRLTKNSLISGYRPEGDVDDDPSFLNQLEGKLFIIKDFTTILQAPREERDSVVGQLRDVFDGTASRVFGNIGLQEYKVRFNMLLAVTNAIDGFHGVNQQLGERFVSRREYGKGRKTITSTAFTNIIEGHNQNRNGTLKDDFQLILNKMPDIPVSAIHWSSKMRKRAITGADFIARCRSHVTREKDGKSVSSRPSPEVGGRLVTQIAQCVASHSIINGRNEVDFQSWKFGGIKILRDTLPSTVAWTLFHAYSIYQEANTSKGQWFTVKDIMPLTRLGWNTTEHVMVDLHHNGILEVKYSGSTGRRNTAYRVNKYAIEIIRLTSLFEDYNDDEIDIATLRKRIRAQERTKKIKPKPKVK